MSNSFLPVKNGRYALVNVSDSIDLSLVILLKSHKENILESYVDLFPHKVSREDIEYYFSDCAELDEASKTILESHLDILIGKLKERGKWAAESYAPVHRDWVIGET